jgi:pyruvate kinase
MDRIARTIEPALGYRHELPQPDDNPSVSEAVSNAACDLAEALSVKAILVPTFSGRTASTVARLRPRRPIIALTHHSGVARHLALEWGVTPVIIPEGHDVVDLWTRSLEAARSTGIVSAGDLTVITAGTAVNMPGTTNVIRVETL